MVGEFDAFDSDGKVNVERFIATRKNVIERILRLKEAFQRDYYYEPQYLVVDRAWYRILTIFLAEMGSRTPLVYPFLTVEQVQKGDIGEFYLGMRLIQTKKPNTLEVY